MSGGGGGSKKVGGGSYVQRHRFGGCPGAQRGVVRDLELHVVLDRDGVVLQEAVLFLLHQLALYELAVAKAIGGKGVLDAGLGVDLFLRVGVLQPNWK